MPKALSNIEIMMEEYLSSPRGKAKIVEIMEDEGKTLIEQTAADAAEEQLQDWKIDVDNINNLGDFIQQEIKDALSSVRVSIDTGDL